jgi:hypothetical protein
MLPGGLPMITPSGSLLLPKQGSLSNAILPPSQQQIGGEPTSRFTSQGGGRIVFEELVVEEDRSRLAGLLAAVKELRDELRLAARELPDGHDELVNAFWGDLNSV